MTNRATLSDGVSAVTEAISQLGGYGPASDASGVPKRTLQNWATGQSKVPFDAAIELLALSARKLGYPNAKEVAISKVVRSADAKAVFNASQQDTTAVPRYDIRLSAGSGSFTDRAEELGPIPFAADFFSKKLNGRTPDTMVIVDAQGDSMLPVIGDGDLVMIDTSETEPKDAIFAVALGDALFVKRLVRRPSHIDLISANDDYPVERIEGADLEQLNIIGRVVWIGRTMVGPA